MQITISDSKKTPDLATYLADYAAWVTQRDADRLEVSFSVSLNADCQLLEAEKHVRTWMKANPGVVVSVSD